MKKDMKKCTREMNVKFLMMVLWILSLVCISCKKIIVENNSNKKNDEKEEEIVPILKTTVFISAIEYPNDYDWRSDKLYGDVDCKVVVFKNNKRFLEVPARANAKTVPYPDMSMLIEGKLYTFSNYNNSTYICKNGKDLYQYENKERIIGIIENNNGIYTLGQGECGFSFRLNGEVILEKDKGYVIGDLDTSNKNNGALYEDNGQICFAYYKNSFDDSSVDNINEENKDGEENRDYYIVVNGEEKEIQNFRTYKKIYDLKIINGRIHLIAESFKELPGPIHYIDGNPKRINCKNITEITNCRLYRNDKYALVQVDGYSNGLPISVFYKNDSVIKVLHNKTTLYHYYNFATKDDNIGYAIHNTDYSVKYVQYNTNATINMNGKYMLMTNRCAFLQKNDMYMALVLSGNESSTITAPAITLYKNNDLSQIEFNGFPTQIEVVEEYVYPKPGKDPEKDPEKDGGEDSGEETIPEVEPRPKPGPAPVPQFEG